MSLLFSEKKLENKIPIALISNSQNKNIKYVYIEYDNDGDDVKEYAADKTETINWQPYIEDDQRFAMYISGISGSGKSSFSRKCIEELRKQKKFKKYPVWFISTRDCNTCDHAFEGLKDFNPLNIYNDKFLDIDYTDFENSIVLFDDWNQLNKKDELFLHIMELLKKMLELGRKLNIEIIIINHLTSNFNETRSIIFEATTYTLFPRSNLNSVQKFVENYITKDKEISKKIAMIRGSQYTPLIINKVSPQYLMSDKWIQIF